MYAIVSAAPRQPRSNGRSADVRRLHEAAIGALCRVESPQSDYKGSEEQSAYRVIERSSQGQKSFARPPYRVLRPAVYSPHMAVERVR